MQDTWPCLYNWKSKIIFFCEFTLLLKENANLLWYNKACLFYWFWKGGVSLIQKSVCTKSHFDLQRWAVFKIPAALQKLLPWDPVRTTRTTMILTMTSPGLSTNAIFLALVKNNKVLSKDKREVYECCDFCNYSTWLHVRYASNQSLF